MDFLIEIGSSRFVPTSEVLLVLAGSYSGFLARFLVGTLGDETKKGGEARSDAPPCDNPTQESSRDIGFLGPTVLNTLQ